MASVPDHSRSFFVAIDRFPLTSQSPLLSHPRFPAGDMAIWDFDRSSVSKRVWPAARRKNKRSLVIEQTTVSLPTVAFHRIAHGPDFFRGVWPATLLGRVWAELADGGIRRLKPSRQSRLHEHQFG